VEVNVTTTPEGARVYAKEYFAPENQWQYLGATPIRKIRLARGFFSWKMQKEGFEPLQAAAFTGSVVGSGYTVRRTLDPQGKIPPGMVRVFGTDTADGPLGDFFIDKYEVTKYRVEFTPSSNSRRGRSEPPGTECLKN
jgi:hypothetical protein